MNRTRLFPIKKFSPYEDAKDYNGIINVGVDIEDNIVVVGMYEKVRWIQLFDRDGNYLEGSGDYSAKEEGVYLGPRGGFDVDSAGRIIIPDTHNSKIMIYGKEVK